MADNARTVAFDTHAPQDERFDAQAELAKSVHSPADVIPHQELAPLLDVVRERWAESMDMLAKTQTYDYAGRGGPPPAQGMQSVSLDGWQVQATADYYERPSSMSFESLRTMVSETPVLSAVVLTRIRQINRFCSISDDGGPGFEICHQDKSHKRTPDEEQACKDLQRFFLNCGWEWRPRERRRLKRGNFQAFMAKSLRDTLSMDSAPIETEQKADARLGISGFYAVDGSTIRLCTDAGYSEHPEAYALQVIQGAVAASYTLDDLIYEPRNPSSDIRQGGYGISETELLVRTVTGFLNAMNLNIRGFDSNQIPKGLLQLVGNYSKDDQNAFRRYWNNMVSGVNNAWTLPVMFSTDGEAKASFEKFGVEYNEMYFSKWMTFLTSIICAIYGMAPDEINFESFAASKSSLSGSDTTEKLADSKDKGLRPLMTYYENVFTDFIVADIAPNFCFRWVGLDPKDERLESEEMRLVSTVDELRARRGEQPHTIPELGNAPLNPALMQVYLQKLQPQEAPDFGTVDGEDKEGGGGDFGGGGGGGDFGTPPGQKEDEEEEEDGQQDGGQPQPGGAPPPPDKEGEGQPFGKTLQTIWAIEP